MASNKAKLMVAKALDRAHAFTALSPCAAVDVTRIVDALEDCVDAARLEGWRAGRAQAGLVAENYPVAPCGEEVCATAYAISDAIIALPEPGEE